MPRLNTLVGDGHLLVIGRRRLYIALVPNILPVSALSHTALTAMLAEQIQAQRLNQSVLRGEMGIASIYEMIGGNPLAVRAMVRRLVPLYPQVVPGCAK